MRYFEKCVTSGSCLHLTVQKSRLWSYQKVIRLSSLIQSKLLEIIVDYIRGEQLQIILKQRRRLRGSTPSRRSRNHVSEGGCFTPNSDLRFSACTVFSSKRTNWSYFSIDGIFRLNIASPAIKQSDRVIPRDMIKSGTRSKHSRISRSNPGIDRSLRKESLDILPLNFACFAAA